MRRLMPAVALLLLTAIGCGGASTTVISKGGPSIAQVRAERYDGPKARLAVVGFRNRASGLYLTRAMSTGMAEMMNTALFQTGRFIVLERRKLGPVIREQNFGRSGRVDPRTAAPIGQLEGAEILVYGTVTDFSSSGGFLGIGAGVEMAVDFHGVDTRTGRVVFAFAVKGSSSEYNVVGVNFWTWGGWGVSLSGWIRTPRGKALRAVVAKAAAEIARRTPRRFFHYTNYSGHYGPRPAGYREGALPPGAVPPGR